MKEEKNEKEKEREVKGWNKKLRDRRGRDLMRASITMYIYVCVFAHTGRHTHI